MGLVRALGFRDYMREEERRRAEDRREEAERLRREQHERDIETRWEQHGRDHAYIMKEMEGMKVLGERTAADMKETKDALARTADKIEDVRETSHREITELQRSTEKNTTTIANYGRVVGVMMGLLTAGAIYLAQRLG